MSGGDWFVDGNWLEPNLQNMFVPSFTFNERGIVNNAGTAFVETDGGASPGQIILGSTAVGSGTLEVRSDGVLNVMAGTATNGGINVGSVGQPRDGDPRAAYGLMDLDKGTIRLRRTAYDVQGAQKRIMKAGLPQWLALRLEKGQ